VITGSLGRRLGKQESLVKRICDFWRTNESCFMDKRSSFQWQIWTIWICTMWFSTSIILCKIPMLVDILLFFFRITQYNTDVQNIRTLTPTNKRNDKIQTYSWCVFIYAAYINLERKEDACSQVESIFSSCLVWMRMYSSQSTCISFMSCLDANVFISIHMYWSGLEWN
jgi:hypothetical protein